MSERLHDYTRGAGGAGAQEQSFLAAERRVILLLVFSFTSGALAHNLPAILPITRYITDGLLLLLNGLVLWVIYRRHRDLRLVWWLLIAYWFTFFVEVAGVATGAVFGEYAYGRTLWVQWLDVPFVIALNWCLLALAANAVALYLWRARRGDDPPPALAAAALAGLILALFDGVIEPVAVALDYWRWAGGVIPLQNYLAWAVVGFLISLPLHLGRVGFRSPVLLVYFVAELGFFLILNLTLA